MAYLLSNICTKNTGIGQLLLKLSLVVGWYPFLRHSVQTSLCQCTAVPPASSCWIHYEALQSVR